MQVEAAPREAMENRRKTARTGLLSLLLQDGAPANTCAKARSEVKRPSSRPCEQPCTPVKLAALLLCLKPDFCYLVGETLTYWTRLCTNQGNLCEALALLPSVTLSIRICHT